MDDAAKVLVVEDQASTRTFTAEMLGTGPGGWGYEVTAVGSVAQARSALGRATFDAAVIDYRLEYNQWGDSIAKEIRLGWPRCGVIIWTGYSTPRLVDQLAPWRVPVIEKGDFKRLQSELARMIDMVRATSNERGMRKVFRRLGYPAGPQHAGLAVVDHTPTVTVDRNFKVKWINPLAAEVLGYDYERTPDEELMAIDLEKHIPAQYREQHRAWVDQFFVVGAPRIMGGRRIPLLRKSGTQIEVEIILVPTPVFDVQYVTALILLPEGVLHAKARGRTTDHGQ